MKRTIIVALFALLTTFSTAQNTFEIGVPFQGIRVSGALKVELIPAETAHAQVTLNGVEQKRVQWNVKDNILNISLRVGLIDRDASADVKIYYTTLDYIGVEGVTLDGTEPIQVESLKFETLGGINRVNLDVDTENLNVEATGDSKINIGGTSRIAKIKAYMGARVDCMKCEIDMCTVVAKQRSEVYINSKETLDATVSMGANLFYLGSPRLTAKANTAGGIINVDPAKLP